jgi:hypothetical protein
LYLNHSLDKQLAEIMALVWIHQYLLQPCLVVVGWCC